MNERLYTRAQLDAIPEDQLTAWKSRLRSTNQSELVSTGVAARMKGLDPSTMRRLVAMNLVNVAARDAGGRDLLKREDVMNLDVSSFRLSTLSAAAHAFGLAPLSLRRLADAEKVSVVVTPTGHRRFDLDVLRDDLDKLGLFPAARGGPPSRWHFHGGTQSSDRDASVTPSS